MLIFIEIFQGEKLSYKTEIIEGYQIWYTKVEQVNDIYTLYHHYRSNEEVCKLFEEQHKEEDYERFLIVRKYDIIRAIHSYFLQFDMKRKCKEIEQQRTIRHKLRKENYKIKYGHRHVKNRTN